MGINILIPDDYQFASKNIDFLHSDKNFNFTIIGDTKKENDLNAKLAKAEALLLIR